MEQLLIKKNNAQVLSDPQLQKTLIVQFYQNHENYKRLAHKFHTATFYLFCFVQVIWFILSYHIITVNNYDKFIQEFQTNIDDEYKIIYLKNHFTDSSILDHINSFANDYTITCWLIWISHLGSELTFIYILYVNRIFFKEYLTGIKEILPIFFTLLTTFAVRDCLLMSIPQVVHYDLKEIISTIQNQQEDFSTYGPNFVQFITTSMILAKKLYSDFSTLQIVNYIQSVCDGMTICVLIVQILRIYSAAEKCQKTQHQIITKKLYAIEPFATYPNSSKCFSEFGSKVSEESQHSLSLYHPRLFNHTHKDLTSLKEISGLYQHNPLGLSSKTINSIEGSSYPGRFFKKQTPNRSNFPLKLKTMKTTEIQMPFHKLKKSGSCNYLKGSQEISDEDVIFQPSNQQVIHEKNLDRLKLKKGVSIDQDIESKVLKRNRMDSFDAQNNQGNHVVFKV